MLQVSKVADFEPTVQHIVYYRNYLLYVTTIRSLFPKGPFVDSDWLSKFDYDVSINSIFFHME